MKMGSFFSRDVPIDKYKDCLSCEDLPYDIIILITKYCTVIKEQITQEEFLMIDYPCYGIISESDSKYKGLMDLCFHTSEYIKNKEPIPVKIPWDLLAKNDSLCGCRYRIPKYDGMYLISPANICIMLYSESKDPFVHQGVFDMTIGMKYTEMEYNIPIGIEHKKMLKGWMLSPFTTS